MGSRFQFVQRILQNESKCRQSFQFIFWAILKRPLEALAMTFIFIASLVVYLNGVIWMQPIVLVHQTISTQCIAFLAATWCLFAIWTNLLLLQFRDTSIRHRLLTKPVIVSQTRTPSIQSDEEGFARERNQAEQIKNLGQQFMVSPHGSENAWHICGTCEVYVPPRAWHCSSCNICILRRDHHCVFAMTCIGEENHANFLGLLAYLSFGTTYAFVLGVIYSFYYLGVPPTRFILKCFFSWYVIFFDFSIINVLSSVALLGGTVSWAVFMYYLLLALKNQTAADNSRGIKRTVSGFRNYSYANLKCFLGPRPILCILWPFSPVLRTDYDGAATNRFNQRDATKTV